VRNDYASAHVAKKKTGFSFSDLLPNQERIQ
jgi:hypothetical protein